MYRYVDMHDEFIELYGHHRIQSRAHKDVMNNRQILFDFSTNFVYHIWNNTEVRILIHLDVSC